MGRKPIIATELLKGQGLGNQLFCYVTVRSLAYAKGYDFSILNREIFANNIHSNKGMYFMDLDCGPVVSRETFDTVYHEREERLFIGNSTHDLVHGCYVAGADEALLELEQTTLVYGNLQAWRILGSIRMRLRTGLR